MPNFRSLLVGFENNSLGGGDDWFFLAYLRIFSLESGT